MIKTPTPSTTLDEAITWCEQNPVVTKEDYAILAAVKKGRGRTPSGVYVNPNERFKAYRAKLKTQAASIATAPLKVRKAMTHTQLTKALGIALKALAELPADADKAEAKKSVQVTINTIRTNFDI